MSKCCFCQKEYKGYPVIMCNKIECFVFEMELRNIYYSEDTGICKECRNEKYDDNIFMTRLWFNVKRMGET